MPKSGLKMRVKKLDNGYAVEQKLRRKSYSFWTVLGVFDTLEECEYEFPYYSVQRSVHRLRGA